MPRRAKFVLVAVVLVVGLLGAWQFRKSPAEKSAAPATAQAETAQHTAAPPRTGAPWSDPSAAPAPPTAPSADPADRFATALSDSKPAPHAEQVLNANPSPPLPGPEKSAEATEDHTAPLAVAKPAETAVPELPASFSGADRAGADLPSDVHADLRSEESIQSTHKIVDGDSLPSLAERYLGSAARAGEIFACNRDVLSDPELLPIGARLRIPTGSARPAVAAVPRAGSTSDNASPPTAPLAASPPAPTPAATYPAPQPRLAEKTTASPPLLNIGPSALAPLPPLGDQANSPGRIYIVQTGDTLSVIARKLYGDSGRGDALLQANRDQLHSEQDLRPGMMLEAP
jgi:nucleoid-associated protein YgaU